MNAVKVEIRMELEMMALRKNACLLALADCVSEDWPLQLTFIGEKSVRVLGLLVRRRRGQTDKAGTPGQ